ncbi:hypothetical protein MGSAQ_002668 [marine sediment metagenome]|uniref:Uncharacterized protein n=1 Tax=marine sediment metagenome TaxID=412755 RepID=A0A1B6NQX6_9ZZZZ
MIGIVCNSLITSHNNGPITCSKSFSTSCHFRSNDDS